MPRPDEGLIHEWLDGELSPDEAARVEELVRTDAAWGAAAAEARGLIAASSRILGALDSVAGDVIPAGSKASGATAKSRARFTVRPWMRAAAGIVLVVGTTVAVRNLAAPRNDAPEAAAVEAKVDAREVAGAPATTAATLSAPAAEPAPERARSADAVTANAPASAPAIPSTIPPAPASVAPPPAPAQIEPRAEQRAQALADARERELADSVTLRREASRRAAMAQVVITSTRAAEPAEVTRQNTEVAGLARGVAAGAATGAASKMLVPPTLDGCWRAISGGVAADSLLRALPIVRTSRDTLELRLDTAGRIATVVREGDLLRGVVRVGASVPNAAPVAWRAERRGCPD